VIGGQFGERLVDELDAFEQRRRAMKSDVTRGGEVDVVRLALADSAAGHATLPPWPKRAYLGPALE
jgi:hypothetical protein